MSLTTTIVICTLLLIVCLGGGQRLLKLFGLAAFLVTAVIVIVGMGRMFGGAF